MTLIDQRTLRIGPIKRAAAALSRARQVFASDSSSAISVFVAARQLLGDHDAWEPEAIWLTLERTDVDLSPINRAKLMAAIALTLVPSFYWDGLVFEKTAISFTGRVPNPAALEEATSAELAWSVREAGWILSVAELELPDFGHEPAAYAAVVLAREGLVLAPPELSFCQDLLDGMNPGSSSLKTEVRSTLAALSADELETHRYEETPTGVQLAQLAAIALHVREQRKRAAADLSVLSG
jgi:hypothetical protein